MRAKEPRLLNFQPLPFRGALGACKPLHPKTMERGLRTQETRLL